MAIFELLGGEKTDPIYENPKCHLDWSVAEWKDLFLSNLLIEIMQNEPNFKIAKMNATSIPENTYGKFSHFRPLENEPNLG